jgi:hypothetical protein
LPDVRATTNIGQIILCVLAIIPLGNYSDPVWVVSGHGTGGSNGSPRVVALRDVRKIALRSIAMLPKSLGDGRTGTGWRWQDREPLPIARANPHIGVIAAGLIAIIPDWPRAHLA